MVFRLLQASTTARHLSIHVYPPPGYARQMRAQQSSRGMANVSGLLPSKELRPPLTSIIGLFATTQGRAGLKGGLWPLGSVHTLMPCGGGVDAFAENAVFNACKILAFSPGYAYSTECGGISGYHVLNPPRHGLGFRASNRTHVKRLSSMAVVCL